MYLTPESIYSDYRNKALDKYSASALLISIIENSKNEVLRVKCIEFIQRIGDTDQKVFTLLENFLISDSYESIRIAAFEAIKTNFALKAINPVKYAINKEKDQFLINLIEFLGEIDPFLCREAIINRIKKLEIDFYQNPLNNIKIEKLNLKKLKSILFNHLFFTSLENLYFHRRKIPFAVDLHYLD